MASYKQKCMKCKKIWVLASHRTRFVICYECQKPEMKGKIKDPKMKKMFAIPEEFYVKSSFLRSIKVNYLKFGELSEKQVEAFKKTVKDFKSGGENESGENKQV